MKRILRCLLTIPNLHTLKIIHMKPNTADYCIHIMEETRMTIFLKTLSSHLYCSKRILCTS